MIGATQTALLYFLSTAMLSSAADHSGGPCESWNADDGDGLIPAHRSRSPRESRSRRSSNRSLADEAGHAIVGLTRTTRI